MSRSCWQHTFLALATTQAHTTAELHAPSCARPSTAATSSARQRNPDEPSRHLVDEAFDLLRRISQDMNVKLADLPAPWPIGTATWTPAVRGLTY